MKRPLFFSKNLLFIMGIIFAVFFSTQLGATDIKEVSAGLTTGKEIYLEACANCHGADGKGVSASILGFDQPVPDFTDCQFAQREPDDDWVIVAHQGGPIRGFSNLMPAFGKVLTEEQLLKAVQYIRVFCTDKKWPRGELNLPKPLVTEKGFPEDELILSTSIDTETEKIANKIVYEKRIGTLNQIEVVIPYGWSKATEMMDSTEKTPRSANLGDLSLGYKRVLLHSLKSGSILSVFGELICPTGDRNDGFGKGTFVFEPFLAYSQVLPAGFFIHSQAGLELPFNTDRSEKEGFFRLVLGRSFTFGSYNRTWSPMVELLAKKEMVSGEKVVYDILPQIQITLNQRQHIMLNFGVRIPINQTEGRNVAVMAYILWDWFDGGFFEGW